MFRLKLIAKGSIPAALEKAERYRLLNEPGQAESICQDILAVEPNNQKALITLILALTDRFTRGFSVTGTGPEELLPRLQGLYERAYYAGIIQERRGKAKLDESKGKSAEVGRFIAYDFFKEAMKFYEEAETSHAPGNDDARLRWNTCARIIMQNKLSPRPADDPGDQLE